MCRPIFVVLQKNIGKIGESPIVLQDFVQDMHDQCMSTFISANWSNLNHFSIEAIGWKTSISRDTHVNNSVLTCLLFFHKYQSLQNATRVWIFRSSWFFRRHWGLEYLNQTLQVQRFHGPHGLVIKRHKHDINPIPNILHVSAIFCKYSKQNTPTGNTEGLSQQWLF